LKRQPNLLHFGDEFTDFSETATLISQPHFPHLGRYGCCASHRRLGKANSRVFGACFDPRWQLTGDNSGWCSPAGLPGQGASAALGERFREKAFGKSCWENVLGNQLLRAFDWRCVNMRQERKSITDNPRVATTLPHF
jgi:hypothetical protein